MADDPEAAYVMPAEALAIAERRAAEDVALLARLLREGLVRRDRPPDGLRAEARRLDALVDAVDRPRVNLAIRPKRRRR